MILCCGEALIDMIPAQASGETVGFVPHTGGAVFNTAIALGRLGADVGLMTGVSTDMFGDQIHAALENSHVNVAQIVRSDRPTTLAFVQLVEGHARYAFFDENSAGRMLRPSDLPAPPKDVTALFFGGISLVAEPGADAYLDFAQRYFANRLVMLDPNIRPAFIVDETVYRTRLDKMLKLTDILKVSDEDMAWICGTDQSVADQIAHLKAKGPKAIVVTKGAEGAEVHLADGRHLSVRAPQVAVVDTVGAGDTFNAGILAYLQESGEASKDGFLRLREEHWSNALRFASKAAAVTVFRAGANPPWARELEEV